ncbi:tetratricopeptide repeat protein [Aestuariirhabdus sp. Z084]|uniref:YfgM family protein n=1 Tax=Aestuariirhabdus haliotis TaxID=2918751 RepID=UPI00201B39E7|nr:tetratricopeptide repeat protein [Aestuariirhabdus haliotis]MCL6415358.1 tetratricopeptide repeat protein [Aestuariirhabdus haliotis]MCL6419114.1 tetratricopeptide repeat protein [Aestuariirhabdus haliotis]
MDRTEEEQIAAIKSWWKANGTAIILGGSLALAGVFGYQAWQKSQQQSAAEASALYQELAALSVSNPEPLNEEQRSTLSHLTDTLKQDHAGSGYAVMAALLKARQAVEQGDLPLARAELGWALEQKLDSRLEAIIRLRLARVTYEGTKESAEQALALIETADQGSFVASYEEVKGDLYVALDRLDAARAAYQTALDTARANGQNRPVVQLKLDDLAVAQEGA